MNTNGYSADTPQHFAIDNAVLYSGYTSLESLGTAVGVQKEGCTVTYTPDVRDMGFDGAPGKVKGMKRILGASVTVETTLMEITTANIKRAIVGSTSSDYPASPATKTHDKIIPTLTIASTEYIDYAIVGFINRKTDPEVFVIKGGLASSPFKMNWQEKGENGLPVTIEGHFDPAALTTVPFEIYNPIDED